MNSEVLNSYPKYDSYKDSGVDWLGEVPEKWVVEKLGVLLKEVSDKNHPDLPLLSITRELGIIERDVQNMDSNHNFIPDDLSGYKKIEQGQFGMNKMKAWQGSYGISPYTGIVSPAYYIFKLNPDLNRDFFSLAIRSKLYVSYFGSASDGVRVGQWDLNKTRMRQIRFVIPTLDEQEKIVRFLNNKVSQVDQAIELKQQQIEKLNEYKQITIQNAVTKGLDSNVKMKDRDIDWVKEIPEHWDTKKLKYLVKIRKRIIGYEGVDVLSITQTGVKVKDITSGEGQLSMDYSKYQIVNIGDFAMNHMDLLTGYVDISKFNGVVSPDYRVFTNETNLLTPNYLINILRMGYKQKIFYKYGQGVSMLGRWRLPADNFNNFSIPVPSIAEQNEITEFIDKKVAEIDSAIELETQQIQQLKEYKTILINQAVTGKIKVS